METSNNGNNIEKSDMTFETAIARLEEIVRSLEGGTAPLDSSLAMFEEGVKLVRLCSDRLDRAEQKMKILVTGEDGTMKTEDFVSDDK